MRTLSPKASSCWNRFLLRCSRCVFICFPTCQVRVVRFYVSCPSSSSSSSYSSSSPSPPRPPPLCRHLRHYLRQLYVAMGNAGPQQGAPDCSGQRRTSTGSFPSGVGSAGPQLPEDMSKEMPEICQPRMSEDIS